MAGRVLPLVAVVTATLGCSSDTINAGGETTETGGEPGLCESAIDPAIYTSPAWSPAPIVATKECPALDGIRTIELSSVTVSGSLHMDGAPVLAAATLIGRNGEGRVYLPVADDGTFTAAILPGHYDVWLSHAPGALVPGERLATENVDLTASTELQLEIPALITLSGAMILDGELAADPIAHIAAKRSDSDPDAFLHPFWLPVVGRMDQGTYAVSLAPGEYEFYYVACNPNVVNWHHIGVNLCFDPLVPQVEYPYESPNQMGVPIAKLAITADTQHDFEVSTVRFSGTLAVEGVPLDHNDLGVYTEDDFGWGWIGTQGGEFDERVVAGTYRIRYDDRAAPLPEPVVLEQDTHLELAIDSFILTVPYEEGEQVVRFPDDPPPRFLLRPKDSFDSSDLHLPLVDETLRVFEGYYRIEHLTRYCWPDYPRTPPSVWLQLFGDLYIDESLEISLAAPALARVALEYHNSAPEHSSVTLVPAFDPDPVTYWLPFAGADGHLSVHGVVPAGTYAIKGDLVEIVDGTTISVIEDSQWLELELWVDGAPAATEDTLVLEPGTWYPDGGKLAKPGRYQVKYYGHAKDGIPINKGAIIDCMTVEG